MTNIWSLSRIPQKNFTFRAIRSIFKGLPVSSPELSVPPDQSPGVDWSKTKSERENKKERERKRKRASEGANKRASERVREGAREKVRDREREKERERA